MRGRERKKGEKKGSVSLERRGRKGGGHGGTRGPSMLPGLKPR